MRPRHAADLSPTPAPRLRPSRAVAESLYRYAPFGGLAADREGRIVAANETACRLLGYEADERTGAPAARDFRAPRGEGHILPGACARPEEAREVEVATKGQDALPVSLRLLPLETESGKLAGTLALFVDLRGEKSRDEQWRRRDRLASLGALAAGVAHEIRNPLAGIGASAQILARRLPAGDRRASFATLIVEEVARLDRIVESLLQFARPATPKLARQSLLPALERAGFVNPVFTPVHPGNSRKSLFLLHSSRTPLCVTKGRSSVRTICRKNGCCIAARVIRARSRAVV